MAPLPPFQTVLDDHSEDVYRFLSALVGPNEAEDCFQETLMSAIRAYPKLDSGANVRAWLFKIATNVFRNHARGERRRLIAHATVQASRREADPDGPEAAAVAGELQALTEATIQRLPVKQRMAFTLRKLHELDYEIIGQSLDCSAETARAHVFQALRKIRTSLDGHVLPRTESTR